jgi:hypothetical protein
MSTDRETTRIVRSWLEEGVTALPDRVLDGVLDQVPATRQRRSWWPGWRFGPLAMQARFSALTASIALVLVIGVMVLPQLVPGGGVQPTPSPSPGPTAEASPTEPVETPLPAGTYSLEGFYPIGVSFTVGPGWVRCFASSFEQGVCRERGNGEVSFLIVSNVVADPCGEALLDPPVGPSVDDLVSAISGLSGFTATTPIDRTVDGFAGKELTITAPSVPGCTLSTWATPDRINGVGLGEANLIRIVDVDGTRVVMTGPYPSIAADTPQAIALIEQVMDSVTFTP